MNKHRTLRRLALATALVGAGGILVGRGLRAEQQRVDAPAPLGIAQATPAPPDDPSRPMDRVAWTLQFDMRQFDASWAWIEREVADEAERNRALAVMSMLAVAELERDEFIEPGIERFDRAIVDFPDDERLLTWRAYTRVLDSLASGDTAGFESALQEARDASEAGYFSFTIWGVILSALPYEGIDDALLAEVLEGLDQMKRRTLALQFEHGDRIEFSMPRLWDSPIAMQNLSATFALKGDAFALAGDVEQARRMYYLALRTNNAYRWAWYDDVARRLEDPGALGKAIRAGEEHSVAGSFPGAVGRDSALLHRPDSDRIGNGTCTYCHSHVGSYEIAGGPNFPVGWVEIPVEYPDSLSFATPTLVAFESPWDMLTGGKPVGFDLGANVPFWLPENFYPELEHHLDHVILALPPGSYAVAGRILRADAEYSAAYSAYLAGPLGIPLTFEVEAQRLTRVEEALVFE